MFTLLVYPCPRYDSNPQSQQASGLTPRGHCDHHVLFKAKCKHTLLSCDYIKIMQCKCHCSIDSPLPTSTHHSAALCVDPGDMKDIQYLLVPHILWLFILSSPVTCVLLTVGFRQSMCVMPPHPKLKVTHNTYIQDNLYHYADATKN